MQLCGREVGVEDCEEEGGGLTGREMQGVRAKYGESVLKIILGLKHAPLDE